MDPCRARRRLAELRRQHRVVVWLTIVSLLAGLAGPVLPATAQTAPPSSATPAPRAAPGARDPLPKVARVGRGQVPPADSEVVARRTQRSRTYATQTGYQTRIAVMPVNYRDASGAWQPIDNTLVAGAGGFRQNKANGFATFLPPSLDAAPVRVARGASFVDFQLVGGRGAAAATAATASYADALPGVAASYTATNGGLKEKLTLAGPTAPSTFSFALRTSQDLTPRANGRGIDFVDASGRKVMAFAPPYMYDASRTKAGVSRAVSLQLTQGPTGPAVALVADPGWLANPARTWPVVIDPEVVVEPDTACAIEDTAPTSNVCGGDSLSVGRDRTGVWRDLLRFDLSAIQAEGPVSVMDAYLQVYEQPPYDVGVDGLELRQLSRAFTTSASWNTYDGTNAWSSAGGDFGSAVLASGTEDAAGAYWLGFAPLVQSWLDGTTPNNGGD